MNTSLSFAMFMVIMLCVVTEAASQLCFKHAANDESLLITMRKPMLWLGLLLWLMELVAWTYVLEHVALSIAFPMMSLTYLTTVIGGAVFYRETITKRHMLGAICITLGVACIGTSNL